MVSLLVNLKRLRHVQSSPTPARGEVRARPLSPLPLSALSDCLTSFVGFPLLWVLLNEVEGAGCHTEVVSFNSLHPFL